MKDLLPKMSIRAALAVAITLVIVKSIGWNATGSVSLFSSLVDSIQDVVVSLVNYVALKYALKPADDDHKFGHGKAEDLATLAQGFFIGIVSILIAVEAISRFSTPHPLPSGGVGIAIMCLSLVLTIGLVTFQKYVVRKTGSNLIEADSVHYLSDILSNLAVLAALVLSTYFGIANADGLFGLLIAAYIFHGAWEVGSKAFDNLMDKEFEPHLVEKIHEIINAHPEVIKVKNLKTRRSGTKHLIYFDFTMKGTATLTESHQTAHQIEDALMAEFPHSEIFIHQEPEV